MTNEQIRQRIAELEEALGGINTHAQMGPLTAHEHKALNAYVQTALSILPTLRAASLLSAAPPASEPDTDAVERAAWEGVRAVFEARHGAGTCPDDRLEDLKAANEIGETWEEYLIACRAAIAAIRPAIDREKIAEIRRAYDEWRGADTLCGLLADPEDEGTPSEKQEAAEHAAWAWDHAAGKFMQHAELILSLIGGSHDD